MIMVNCGNCNNEYRLSELVIVENYDARCPYCGHSIARHED